jgi:hypothetical protein
MTPRGNAAPRTSRPDLRRACGEVIEYYLIHRRVFITIYARERRQ